MFPFWGEGCSQNLPDEQPIGFTDTFKAKPGHSVGPSGFRVEYLGFRI